MTRTRPLNIFIAHPSPVCTDYLPHGDGLVSYGFIRRLAERGHQLHVAAERVELRQPMPGNVHLYALTGGRHARTDRLAFMVRMRLLFERLRRRVPFDVVHQMNPVVTGLSLALIGSRTPLVLGTFVPAWDRTADVVVPSGTSSAGLRASLQKRIARLQQRHAAGLLIASGQAITRICEPVRHGDRIHEVPHGIDLTQFAERTTVPEHPLILFLAGLAPRKGVFTLLEAFTSVVAQIPSARLVIAGGVGDELAAVRRHVDAMSCAGITVTGAVAPADVQDVMRAHSVYCLPSYGEPYGMSVLEAMACGLPVVATRAGGIPDLVTDEGARLVPVRDPVRLAAALVEVLRSRELQQRMGRHNRQRVEARFDAEAAVDRLEDAYHAVITRAGSARRGVRAIATVADSMEPEGPAC